MDNNRLWDFFFENIKKIVFPEEWIKIDLALSKQEIFTLILIERRGEIIMSQIADFVNVPMSTATGIVDRLVKNGYLERSRSEEDRRVVTVRLTDKAKALVQEIKSVSSKYMAMIFKALTDEEREFLFRIAAKVMGVLKEKSGPGESAENRLRKIEIQ